MMPPDIAMRNAMFDLQKGRYREAIGAFQMVWGNDRAPVMMRSDALSNAAVCHLRLHEWKSAEDSARAAVEMDPAHVDAWFNLAGSLKEQGQVLDALHAFRKVCELHPQRMDGWRYRAELAEGLGLWEEAVDAWSVVYQKMANGRAFEGRIVCMVHAGKAPLVDEETALYLDQHKTENLARYLRVLVLSDLQRFDEAVVLTHKMHGPAVDQLVAWVLIHAGYLIEARERVKGLPECARAHALRIMAAEGPEVIERIADALTYLSTPRKDHPQDIADLHFRLARIAEEQSTPAAAMQHYHAAHRIMAVSQPFSEEGHHQLDTWIRLRPWLQLAPPAPRDGPQWIFIVGMPRSGTTLLEQILDMHPAFHGAGELHDMATVAQRYYATGNGEAVLQACDAFSRKGSNLAPRAAWCIDKMPHNFVHAGMILHLFPRARVIWCRRDRMDNCTSIYRQHFRGIHPYAHDLGTLGRYFRWHEEVMEGYREDYPQRVLEVSYEALVDDMPGTVTDLLRALGKDWDPACARFYENPRRILTASQGQVNKPIYRDTVGSWKRYRDYVEPLLLEEPVMSDSANESQRR